MEGRIRQNHIAPATAIDRKGYMMKKFLASAGLAVLLLAGCYAIPTIENPAPKAETDTLLAAMEKASNPGGRKVKTMRLTYRGEIPTNSMTMEIIYSMKAPDKSRTELRMPGMPPMIEVFDGKQGWAIIAGMGAKPKTERELAFARLQVKMNDPANKLTDIFPDIKLDPQPVDVNGVSCRRLVCAFGPEINLPPAELFVDAQTHLIRRAVLIAPTEMGDVPGTTDFSDYRNYGGLMLPSKQTSKMLGMDLTATLQECKLDLPLEDRLFTPAEEEEDDDAQNKKQP